MKVQLLLGALLPLASAHFTLVYPAARGFDEDVLSTFPCGGQNTVSSNRTEFPLTGAPIQLLMGHTSAKVQVLMALGNDPGSNFEYVLLPTIQEQGPQDFCIGAGALQFPAGLNITAGMNATIQVVTNGDPSGGLYNVSYSPRICLKDPLLTMFPVRRHHIHLHRAVLFRIQLELQEQHGCHRPGPDQRRQRKPVYFGCLHQCCTLGLYLCCCLCCHRHFYRCCCSGHLCFLRSRCHGCAGWYGRSVRWGMEEMHKIGVVSHRDVDSRAYCSLLMLLFLRYYDTYTFRNEPS